MWQLLEVSIYRRGTSTSPTMPAPRRARPAGFRTLSGVHRRWRIRLHEWRRFKRKYRNNFERQIYPSNGISLRISWLLGFNRRNGKIAADSIWCAANRQKLQRHKRTFLNIEKNKQGAVFFAITVFILKGKRYYFE